MGRHNITRHWTGHTALYLRHCYKALPKGTVPWNWCKDSKALVEKEGKSEVTM